MIDAAQQTARMLLEIEAVHIRPSEPFTLTSGYASPVYVDCRKVISFPRARQAIIRAATEMLQSRIGYESIDAVAGGETAGIPYAAWLADSLNVPMLYVRKKPKGFGRNAQIEGTFKEGARVLLVEDLASDGGSKVNFVNALRTAGATVTDCFVVFFYAAFPGGLKSLDEIGVNLHSLATWKEVLDVAEKDGRLPAADIAEVRKFLADPVSWSVAHGGAGQKS
ncbi:orotate phosphoribosyltransferase [Lacibacterium aquatile]|uniref:Orotate phosphoribosyltransferase n=1 Tax=Lacibacterium aquatile TaxID=1168082 RepID=A0ABW5DV88_9PROT